MIDQLVSSDLAALAADSRGSIAALDALLPDERVQAEPATLLGLANAYADGVARVTWGASALVFVVGVLAIDVVQAAGSHWIGSGRHAELAIPFRGLLDVLPDLQSRGTAISLLLVGVLIASGARRMAAARFARRVGASPKPVVVGSALVAHVAPWSIALRSAGVAMLAVFFTSTLVFHMSAPIETAQWDWLMNVSATVRAAYVTVSQWHSHDLARLRNLCIAVPALVVASIWIARRRPRFLFDRRIGWGALGVALLAVAVAQWLGDPEAWMVGATHMGTEPRFHALRSAVTAVGALALFIAVASSSLRRTRTE
ncbi:MAG TPA: hypothetical protein VGG74_23965 [Kofleriaceae bacterium]|jgi:hypothetical protein